MSSRRTTTTTTEQPTTVVIEEKASLSPLIIAVIAVCLLVIVVCIVIIIVVYRKKKNGLIKVEPAESEKLSLGKKRSSIDSAMKQRVFSIDSERGLSDPENANTLNAATSDDERAADKQVTRSSSKASFKSIAFIARMSSNSNKSNSSKKGDAEEAAVTSDSEAELDPKAISILQTLTKPKRQSERTRMAKKHLEDQKTKAIFSTAKKLYEGQISTLKRTNGRQNSAGTQTSPAGSFISIPGLLESADSGSEVNYDTPPPRDKRSFFVYLVTDANSMYKKDCIGKISLPDDVKQFTLSQLRSYLLTADDEVLRSVLKNNKNFKFVNETYKSVAQEEKVTSIDDIYINQGIFVKFIDGQFIPCDAKVGAAIVDHNVSGVAVKRRSRRRRNAQRSITPARHPGPEDSASMHVNVESPRRRAPSRHRSPIAGDISDNDAFFSQHNPDSFKRRGESSIPPTRLRLTVSPSPPSGLEADFSLDEEKITERLRKRHIECISPLPLKYKEAYKRQVLLISEY